MTDHRRELIELAKKEEAEEGPFESGYYGQAVVETTQRCLESMPDEECDICEACYEMQKDD